jgi:hypothetical protein
MNIINNRDTYPIVIIPEYIIEASSTTIKFGEVYPNIKIPSAPILKKNLDDKELKIIGGGIGCGFFFYIGFGLLCLIITNIFLDIKPETWKSYWFPTILTISIVVGILTIFTGFKGNEIEIKKSEDEYQKNYPIYLENLKKYKDLVSNVNSEKFQYKERLKRKTKIFENIRKQIFNNLEILEDNAIKKGMSEEFFYKFLQKYSDITVYKSIKHSYYYPDLILVKSNIVTILEIDEPYVNDTKEPIHFDNSDKNRDDYFISKNFIIMRFTEEQILNYTEECLDVINEIFEYCTELKSFTKSDTFIKIETPKLSYQEAFDLAYNNSRKTVPDKIKRLEKKYL